MRLIVKSKEPPSWTEFRLTEGAKYEATPDLRNALYRDQGGICGYCMGRLQPEPDPEHRQYNRIDHVKARTTYPELQLSYDNMVMCCCGETPKGQKDAVKHCDNYREDRPITLSPMDPRFISTIRYSSDGSIRSDNAQWDTEMDKTLNLNCDILKSNRKAVHNAFISAMGKDWTAQKLRRQLNNWVSRDKDGLYRPYSGMIINIIERKLRQLKK